MKQILRDTLNMGIEAIQPESYIKTLNQNSDGQICSFIQSLKWFFKSKVRIWLNNAVTGAVRYG